MAYLIDPTPILGGTQPVRYERDATIVLVGCGGTGGFLAEAICRLLIGRPARLYLVDMDRVEPHNVARQSFDQKEIGSFKAKALAERLCRRYGREIGYSVLPYDPGYHAQVFGEARSRLSLLIGCVDNASARREIAVTLDRESWIRDYPHHARPVWWLDCGNGRNSGQVLLGNVTKGEALRGAFSPKTSLCRALPAPSLQRPDLLEAPPVARNLEPDCAEAAAVGDQGHTINQVGAAIAASYVEKLLASACYWMASYFDLDDGTLRCVPADPKVVAAVAGLHTNAVVPFTGQT